MYRNCGEHPQISEVLQNGEPSEIKPIFLTCNCSFAVLENLQVRESIELSEKEYSDICEARKT